MQKNLSLFALTILLFGIPAGYYLNVHELGEDALGLTLRISARLALLIFLLIFVARPLRQLSVNSPGKWLLKNRRYLGIAFAAIMTAHLVLLITLNGVQPVIPGMIAFVLVYLMLATSFDGPAARLGPKRWRILHKSGLYFIGAIFTLTVTSNVREAPGEPIYLGLAALLLVAVGIRIAAYAKSRT